MQIGRETGASDVTFDWDDVDSGCQGSDPAQVAVVTLCQQRSYSDCCLYRDVSFSVTAM